MLYLSVDEETQSMEDLKVTTFIMHNWINISHHANERATEKITMGFFDDFKGKSVATIVFTGTWAPFYHPCLNPCFESTPNKILNKNWGKRH